MVLEIDNGLTEDCVTAHGVFGHHIEHNKPSMPDTCKPYRLVKQWISIGHDGSSLSNRVATLLLSYLPKRINQYIYIYIIVYTTKIVKTLAANEYMCVCMYVCMYICMHVCM